MANSNHLDVLKQGVEAWKNWREQNPTQRPDLSGLTLVGINILSISHQKHTIIEIAGATQMIALIRDSIVPWRSRHAGEVGKVNRAMTRSRIILREAEILKLRSETESNHVEARMLEAEAAKKRTEANLLYQKASEIRQYIYKDIEADLLKLLPTENISKNHLAQFKTRSAAFLQALAGSSLAD